MNDFGPFIKLALLIFALMVVVVFGMIATGNWKLPQGDQADAVRRNLNGERPIAFVCADGKTINADFESGTIVLVLSDGRSITLPKGRYSNTTEVEYANPDRSFVFAYTETHGSIVENGKLTYAACPVKR